MPCTRITVTLPEQVVADVDRFERNRSRFVLEAVRNGTEPYVTARSAARTVDLVLSLYQSQQSGAPVTLRDDL